MWVDYELLTGLQDDYKAYKRQFAKNIVFNQDAVSLGENQMISYIS